MNLGINESHGYSATKIYDVWAAMKSRCHTITNKDYKYYGAKGISVCQEWRDNFIAF